MFASNDVKLGTMLQIAITHVNAMHVIFRALQIEKIVTEYSVPVAQW